MLLLRHVTEGTPDAPLLLLHGDDAEAFAQIVQHMRRLSTRDIVVVRITDIPGVTSADGTDITMMTGESDEGASRSSRGGFEWRLTVRGWDDMAELLSPFAERSSADRVRHQRLVPQFWMPATGVPVMVTTSTEGQW